LPVKEVLVVAIKAGSWSFERLRSRVSRGRDLLRGRDFEER